MLRPSVILLAVFFLLSPSMTWAEVRRADAEFGGACVMGLAEGKRIETDCKVHWQANGKTYCFLDEAFKAEFLKDPNGNIAKAAETFAAGISGSMESAMGRFSADDVTQFVEEMITAAQEKSGGAYPIADPVTGQTLMLRFEKVDFVRTIHGYGFFPDVVFTAKDDTSKKYLVDFWLRPKGRKLAVVDTRIYKAPRREDDRWVMITRSPKPWWWIPASEHPGASETKRSWQIMSVMHDHIAAGMASEGGAYKLKDDKTGETLSLDFIGIHQPVRRLKGDGRYFACTDFRKAGSTDEYYDIDFWLDEKNGTLKVGDVRVHKVPVLVDGNFVQQTRYQFDPKTFDVIP